MAKKPPRWLSPAANAVLDVIYEVPVAMTKPTLAYNVENTYNICSRSSCYNHVKCLVALGLLHEFRWEKGDSTLVELTEAGKKYVKEELDLSQAERPPDCRH